jgi:predicted phage terminase large subunit-like protein
LEPVKVFVPNWHLDAVCDHLAAVSKGEILNLIINIPPRHTKSLTASVFWPAWEWIDSPSVQFLYSSYAENLSIRDSVKTRRLIQSPWYRERWGDRYRLTSDQNQKIRFDNDKQGYRLATAVGGSNTGEGGDRIVIDDPNNVKKVESDADRLSVNDWWDLVMSTRRNDPKTSGVVIMMQRSHEDDLTGHILKKELGYDELVLPARYEGNRCKTSLHFTDPRTKEGEALNPRRYDDKELTKLERELGEYGTAGQLQQRPHPRKGGLFKADKFVVVEGLPGRPIRTIRYWDKAATEGGGSHSSGVKMALLSTGQYAILDVQRGQWSVGYREARIKLAAQMDKVGTKVYVEQEPGSGGKESALSTVRNLAGFAARAERATVNKVARAEPYAAQVEIGNVVVLSKTWTKAFIEEHRAFPRGTYADQVDAASGAFNRLTGGPRAGVW